MINKVILIGNLGRDPEIRYSEGNLAHARFSVATNESYRDKNGEWQTITEWHNIVAWRQLAERVEKQLKKGMLIYLEGKLTHRKYQDKDGNDRYSTEVVANTIRLLERRDTKPGPNEEAYAGTGPTEGNVSQGNGGEQQADDDLPF